MKILIGTPIHVNKDYSTERWLKSVSELRLKHPADFLMVDNSFDASYVKKVKGYCAKFGITDYKIKHISANQDPIVDGVVVDKKEARIEIAQGIIKKAVLSKNYDAWFNWESDVILPTNALDEMIRIMQTGNFMIVAHNCLQRGIPNSTSSDFEITLISRKCSEKYGSLLAFVSGPDYLGIPKSQRDGEESFFKYRVAMSGGNSVEVYNIIKPIYHLDK